MLLQVSLLSIQTITGFTAGTDQLGSALKQAVQHRFWQHRWRHRHTATTTSGAVTIAAVVNDTSAANQFLAGPTGAGGAAVQDD